MTITAGYHVTNVAGVKLIFGSVPINDMIALTKIMPKKSVMDLTLARYAGATIAMGTAEDCRRVHREKLVPMCHTLVSELAQARRAGLPEAACTWLLEGNRGASSDTMFSRFAGFDCTQYGDRGALPQDPGDYCRCRQLLETVPAFWARIDELRDISPGWNRLVSEWDHLRLTMDAEAPRWREGKGKAPRTGEMLEAINREHEARKGTST